MHDPVADVIGERAALDSGAAAGIILSLLLHASIAGAAFYAATHAKPPQIAGVLNIRFAPMPSVAARFSAPAPKPAAPRIEPPKPEPLKTVDTKKPIQKNTVPFSPFGKSTKKGSEHPKVEPPKPVPAAPAEPQGVSAALEGGDFPYTMYLDRMKTRIGANWFRPSVDATVVVYFAIDRDGSIRDARVETSSGNGMADRAALRAVLESSPLPPLPFAYNGTYLGVHLTFR
ncbi:MAG TPA: TonB family protein [Thermoanaerobaculia bacterium]|nr:TonB family protein [Thermoanaerobaculia bacterium]